MKTFDYIVLIFCIIILTVFFAGVETGKKTVKTYEDIIKSNCQKLIDEDIVTASKARLTKDFRCYLKIEKFGSSEWREATKEELNLLPY